jgi:uncharacterized lipoprotein YbaY
MRSRFNALPVRLLTFLLFSLLWVASGSSSALASSPAQAPTPGTVSNAPSSTVIQNVTMAAGVSDSDKQPVSPTTVFQPTSVVHAVVAIAGAPMGTQLGAKWYVTDVGNAAAPNTLITSTSVTTDGTRNIDFNLTPNSALPAGQYRVEISIADQVVQTVPFSVAVASASTVIQSVTMAAGVSDSDKQPVNPTTVFQPDSVLHAVVAITNAPANTQVTAKWYATDVGSAAAPNSLITSTNVTTDGTRNIDFNLTHTNPLPVGQYRVEISIGDQVAQVVPFSVAAP